MKDESVKIGGRTFLFSAAIILALMIASGILTKVLPAGAYDRVVSEGRTLVVEGSYKEITRPAYPFWRWFTAPFEILAGPDNVTPIVLIIFIMVVAGSITVLEHAGVMQALVNFLAARFAKRKYLLIVIMVFFFMSSASFVGMYEEMVALIVFVIPISISLGWDSMTGLGMSLLPLSFGFASAVTNPFTIGVAQKIAGLPLFSGASLRLVFFAVIFAFVSFFVIRYAKKVEKNAQCSICFKEDEALRQKLRMETGERAGAAAEINKSQWRALIWFVSCIGLSLVLVISTARMPVISDIAFPLMTVLFLIGGIGAGFFARVKAGELWKSFAKGIINILPGILLVLMAYSVKHIITAGMIMDTILYRAAGMIGNSPPLAAAFLIYATTLIMNFFIGSASAKAFLMMPLLTPLADLVGITRQTAVLAFDFGDGFSNMIYPTNALLLIALSFTVVGYTKWMRWTWKLQIAILIITSAFLAFAVKIAFGPF
ncbi:MAG: AbgT family transporter [Treponema sp.]|jgi:uncharacterized ion transporter superfamily protein YfcC|nr:AbgT family transporter [Treponema sp.]